MVIKEFANLFGVGSDYELLNLVGKHGKSFVCRTCGVGKLNVCLGNDCWSGQLRSTACRRIWLESNLIVDIEGV